VAGQQYSGMPVLSRFYGLVIYMNYREHEPAHFHVRYQGYEASIELDSRTVTGRLPRRALRLTFDWMDLHRDELQANWENAKKRQSLKPINPLS
jgi:hypothetical protein